MRKADAEAELETQRKLRSIHRLYMEVKEAAGTDSLLDRMLVKMAKWM